MNIYDLFIPVETNSPYRSVKIAPDFGSKLSQEQQEAFDAALQHNLQGLNALKDNPDNIRLLDQETKSDIGQGLDTLSAITLYIASDEDEDFIAQLAHEPNSLMLNLSKKSLTQDTSEKLRFIIGHEIGHSILDQRYITKELPENNTTQDLDFEEISTRKEPSKTPHMMEFGADKIGIMLNPDVNLLGIIPEPKGLAQKFTSLSKDKPVSAASQLISEFYLARDAIVNTITKPDPVLRHFINNMFHMSAAPSHPSTFARQVKGTQFQQRLGKTSQQ